MNQSSIGIGAVEAVQPLKRLELWRDSEDSTKFAGSAARSCSVQVAVAALNQSSVRVAAINAVLIGTKVVKPSFAPPIEFEDHIACSGPL
jgi:hypothetical protein